MGIRCSAPYCSWLQQQSRLYIFLFVAMWVLMLDSMHTRSMAAEPPGSSLCVQATYRIQASCRSAESYESKPLTCLCSCNEQLHSDASMLMLAAIRHWSKPMASMSQNLPTATVCLRISRWQSQNLITSHVYMRQSIGVASLQ